MISIEDHVRKMSDEEKVSQILRLSDKLKKMEDTLAVYKRDSDDYHVLKKALAKAIPPTIVKVKEESFGGGCDSKCECGKCARYRVKHGKERGHIFYMG